MLLDKELYAKFIEFERKRIKLIHQTKQTSSKSSWFQRWSKVTKLEKEFKKDLQATYKQLAKTASVKQLEEFKRYTDSIKFSQALQGGGFKLAPLKASFVSAAKIPNFVSTSKSVHTFVEKKFDLKTQKGRAEAIRELEESVAAVRKLDSEDEQKKLLEKEMFEKVKRENPEAPKGSDTYGKVAESWFSSEEKISPKTVEAYKKSAKFQAAMKKQFGEFYDKNKNNPEYYIDASSKKEFIEKAEKAFAGGHTGAVVVFDRRAFDKELKGKKGKITY